MSNAVRITIQPEVSPEAAEYVEHHRQEVERLVKRQVEAVARSGRSLGDDELDSQTEQRLIAAMERQYPRPTLPPALRHLVVQAPPDPGHLTVSEAARRLEVTRQTVYNWIEAHDLIAFRVTDNALGIPAEQILGPRKVVPDLARVLGFMEDPRLAWSFLTQELPFFTGEPRRPIDVLKTGDVEAVLKAADAYGSDFT